MVEASDHAIGSGERPYPICITGMHRSGTSMVARLLSLCGFYLGPYKELLRAAPDNEAGFWENPDFVLMNDNLLAMVHAGWDCPPSDNELWSPRPELDGWLTKAEQLIDGLSTYGRWGWKDPRTSLTLPFWLRLIPDLKVIICVRNPLEVARSLSARNGTSLAFGLNLWQLYNQRAGSVVTSQNHLVTHYETYFTDPRAELRRLLDFLNVPATEAEIDDACLTVTSNLRHQKISPEDLAAQASPTIVQLYSELCVEAGSVFPALAETPLSEEAETVGVTAE
jgi:hypothetical protein